LFPKGRNIDHSAGGLTNGDLVVAARKLSLFLKTAKQIGLTIPPNVLARANRVIK
jgi:hypothetical protein